MKKYIEAFFVLISAVTAYQELLIWAQRLGDQYLHSVAYSLEVRPGVYRILLPLLSRVLEDLTGINAVMWLSCLVVLSGVALYFSIKYLYTAFIYDDRAELIAFLGCEAIYLLILLEPHVYDIPTAALFATSLGLLARQKYLLFYLMFPIVTLNRETSFLLTLVYTVCCFAALPRLHWLNGILYQGLVYTVLRMLILRQFASYPGVDFVLSLPFVLRGLLREPVKATLLVMILALVLYFTFKHWSAKPRFLRLVFLILFPLQVGFYLMFGSPFETRLFAESSALITVLIAYPTGEYNPTQGVQLARSG